MPPPSRKRAGADVPDDEEVTARRLLARDRPGRAGRGHLPAPHESGLRKGLLSSSFCFLNTSFSH